MSRPSWDERWRRARQAATDPGRAPAGVAAVGVEGDHAAVLDLSFDAARLLVLHRGPGGFEAWTDPIVEPLKHLGPIGPVRWTVGPLKIAEEGRATWAIAGSLDDPPPRIGVRAGDRWCTSQVTDGCFAGVVPDVPAEIAEIAVCGLPNTDATPLWEVTLPAADELTIS